MACRVVKLAVAGSGKTYSLCQDVNDQEKTLILAFTHANIRNIVNELIKKNQGDRISERTCVMTFDSFVYRYAVSPYLRTIASFFGCEGQILGGVTDTKHPTRMQWTPKGPVERPAYKKDDIRYYTDQGGRFYLSTLSELVISVKKGRLSLLNDVATALSMFWERVLVDEFQDFRKFDYEFLVGICKKHRNVTCVADDYQHSVAAKGNSGKPFKIKKHDVSYSEFVQELKNLGFTVDESSLNASRRCSVEICEFVSLKLGVRISSCSPRRGSVVWVGDALADQIMSNDRIVKLVYENARAMSYTACNWSYSKGDTYESVCVILGESTNNLDMEYPDSTPRSQITANKLYVAMTRSSGDLYIMKDEIYRRWKERHGISF